MPGLLEPNAVCPMCQKNLLALVDTSNTQGVTREYFHEPGTQHCKRFFPSHNEAAQERYMLEVHTTTQ